LGGSSVKIDAVFYARTITEPPLRVVVVVVVAAQQRMNVTSKLTRARMRRKR
jgi:hypothetical protein